ncbi:hypothetical protein EAJ17_11095 [Akkermansia sp. aa_0143]|nr:hypothetical protein EAJ17_11095 [Akkermansia sp. aa_0143]
MIQTEPLTLKKITKNFLRQLISSDFRVRMKNTLDDACFQILIMQILPQDWDGADVLQFPHN